MQGPAHFVVLPASGAASAIALGDGVTVIGSGKGAGVHIADPEVEALHAEVHATTGGYLLVRHAQPLQVNGLKVRQHVLAPFDLVTVGKTALSFRPGAVPRVGTGKTERKLALTLCRSLTAFTRSAEQGAPREVLGAELVRAAIELIGASRGALLRLTGDDAEPVGFSSARHGDFTDEEHSFSRSVIARMREVGRPIFVADTTIDRSLAVAPSLQDRESRSVLCAPIRRGETLVGALYASGSSTSLDEDALELLALFAQQGASLLAAAERDRVLESRLAAAEAPREKTLLRGSSVAMASVRKHVHKVAKADLSILVTGETGTGKELVARELHAASDRAAGPFVVVHCGAIPAELLQSELFGHVKGAFTHAQRDRVGFVRSAHGGTLFLDEIGEMPLAQQVALLRVLQERQVTPVGAERAYPVDFRLVAATNRDLEKDVAEGRFRQDLYYRVAGVVVLLPPLRAREKDALELAEHFLREHAASTKRNLRFGPPAAAAILAAKWEGNVRELEAAVKKAAALADDDVVKPEDLGLGATPKEPSGSSFVQPLALVRDDYLKRYVREVVAKLGGSRAAAAEALMVSVRTIYKYMDEL